MKKLTYRTESTEKYIDNVLDSDLIGIKYHDGRIIIVKDSQNNFIGVESRDEGNESKWSADTKKEYIERFGKLDEVILFDSEAEMMIWYNNLCK